MEDYIARVQAAIRHLFESARVADEAAFVFSILGIDSAMEDIGWQPIAETIAFHNDFLNLFSATEDNETRVRIGLVLYGHLVEASYPYHIIYNLLQTIAGETPKIFNFLKLYRKAIPPSVQAKINAIKALANNVGHSEIATIICDLYKNDIRNAFAHSDYVLFDGELRLKHKGLPVRKMSYANLMVLLDSEIVFFRCLLNELESRRTSYPAGYTISGRKSKSGYDLATITLSVDEQSGILTGFSASGPCPMW